jgi:hypothetical protein
MLRSFCCFMLLGAIVGCGGVSVTPTAARVAVTGNVTLAGQPLTDVDLNLQPTGDGLPAVVKVKDGKFEAELVPGKYTYFLSQASGPAGAKAIAKVPVTFLQGSADREVEFAGPGPVEFAMK